MDEKIRRYAELMKELGLTKLEVDEKSGALSMEMNKFAPAPAVLGAPAAMPVEERSAAPDDGSIKICSPMVGVFYAAPAEDAEPFVRVGDAVRKGDVLCIIEAMKLMNEIVAEQDGVITEICVNNNQVVDFGRLLFKMRKDTV